MAASPPPIRPLHPRIEEVLDAFGAALAADRTAYRGHVYRVFHACVALAASDGDPDDGIALASVFHDLGIWSDGTLDYLPPSARRLRAHVAAAGNPALADELERMVLLHHKLTPCRGPDDRRVEAFRRADLFDLTFGMVRFGLPRAWVRELYAAFPAAGFQLRVVQLVGRHALAHPLRPLPMVRL